MHICTTKMAKFEPKKGKSHQILFCALIILFLTFSYDKSNYVIKNIMRWTTATGKKSGF